MCLVRISQKQAISFLWNNDWLVSSLRTLSVFFAAGTQLLNVCITITFRLANLLNSVRFSYSSQLTVFLLSKEVTASNKTRISITVLT
jgi:hypothetical protein